MLIFLLFPDLPLICPIFLSQEKHRKVIIIIIIIITIMLGFLIPPRAIQSSSLCLNQRKESRKE